MAKQSAIEQDGVMVEALSNAMFRVELEKDRKSTRLNSSHNRESRMPSSA